MNATSNARSRIGRRGFERSRWYSPHNASAMKNGHKRASPMYIPSSSSCETVFARRPVNQPGDQKQVKKAEREHEPRADRVESSRDRFVRRVDLGVVGIRESPLSSRIVARYRVIRWRELVILGCRESPSVLIFSLPIAALSQAPRSSPVS